MKNIIVFKKIGILFSVGIFQIDVLEKKFPLLEIHIIK